MSIDVKWKKDGKLYWSPRHHLMSTELQAVSRTKSLDFDMRKYHVKNQAKILGQGFQFRRRFWGIKIFHVFYFLTVVANYLYFKKEVLFLQITEWILFLEEFFARMCQNWKIYSEMKQRELEIDLSHNSSTALKSFLSSGTVDSSHTWDFSQE